MAAKAISSTAARSAGGSAFGGGVNAFSLTVTNSALSNNCLSAGDGGDGGAGGLLRTVVAVLAAPAAMAAMRWGAAVTRAGSR